MASLRLLFPLLSLLIHRALCEGLAESQLEKHVDSLTLSNSFNPIKEAYWTGYPHHRRTPFAVSPDGSTAYIAYLDSSETDVHIQQVDPATFEATGSTVTVTGAKEAGGLVAHDDGFALLTNEALPSGTENAPSDSTPVPVLYRYAADGTQSWKTFLGGPDVDSSFGLVASPDINGDLVYSSAAGYYAAYVVITAYTGDAAGHYGDAIRYVSASDGALTTIAGASSDWGCSHNTGIALEAADSPPFASLCAEDQGAIWLNTKTQGMTNDGVKVSNEHVINGASNEPMGGMSGSYSSLARFGDGDAYAFAWVSRGAINLAQNEWMGSGYTTAENRTVARRVALAVFSDKYTLVGEEAISEVGADDGDTQVNWLSDEGPDAQNAHVAVFDAGQALVTWEEIENPICDFDAMGCRGVFSGTVLQLVTSAGDMVGESLRVTDVYVAGDMVTMADGRICWPYVSMDWTLEGHVSGTSTTSMSFACVDLGNSVDETDADISGSAQNSATSTVATSTASSDASISPSSDVSTTTEQVLATTETTSSTSTIAPVTSLSSSEFSTESFAPIPVSSKSSSAFFADGTTLAISPSVLSSPSSATTQVSETIASPSATSAAAIHTQRPSTGCRAKHKHHKRKSH